MIMVCIHSAFSDLFRTFGIIVIVVFFCWTVARPNCIDA